MDITNEQVENIASRIVLSEVEEFIKEHQAEYQEYLHKEKRNEQIHRDHRQKAKDRVRSNP